MSSESNTNSGGMYGTSSRKPLIALLLSICPGLGQHYAGYLKRGIVLYISLIITSWLAAIAFMAAQNKIVSILFLCIPFAGFGLIALDAYNCALRQPKVYRLKGYNRPWIYAAVFLTLLFTVNPLMDFLIGRQVVRAFFMTSSSMSPTILERDIVLVNKFSFPGRQEIALIKIGDGKASAKLTQLIDDQLIKRIIAIPGDTLEIRNNVVWLNGQEIEEPHAHYNSMQRFTNPQYSNFGPLQIPPDSYFVMGDNRNVSIDSRILGLIHKSQIGGTVTKVFWSWNFDEGSIRWDRTTKSLK